MLGKALLGVAAAVPLAAVVLVGAVASVAGGTSPGDAGLLGGAVGGAADGGVGSAGAELGGVGDVAAAAVQASAGEIPPEMLALYRAGAATCPGLAWEVLAGIGRVETDHGRDVAVSSAGAEGPMQFLPGTWAEYAVDADGTDAPDIEDPADSVLTAARMLCADGAGTAAGVPGAVFAYNHSVAYVSDVLGWAAAYAAVYGPGQSGPAG